MRTLIFTLFLLLSGYALGEPSSPSASSLPSPSSSRAPCKISDFQIVRFDENDPHCEKYGCGGGAGQEHEVAMIKNISKRTCLVSGYTVSQYISGYQDFDGKRFHYKKTKVDVTKIPGPVRRLKPNEALLFTVDTSPIAASDINPVIDNIILVFDGVQGHFSWGGYRPLSDVAVFGELGKPSW